ncbi:PQQ-binding-like beta-propeller repeat protein [candidate division WOR-3 bacterium]|nr:PQQ-binding-like beta-propeller repeat protein [candidate division WOR-3 bacterium]
MKKVKTAKCKMQNYKKEGKMLKRFTINDPRLIIFTGMAMLLGGANSFAGTHTCQPPTDSTWPMFRHDYHHTGLSPLTGDMDTCYFLWSYKTRGWIRSSPALGDIDGDRRLEVVIGSWDENVYALNAQDGSLLWSYKAGPKLTSSPALGDIDGDGKLEVVIGSGDYNLYALNGEDGSLLWFYTTGDWVESSPVLGDIDGDGKLEVVVGSWDNSIYALNGEDGSLVWLYTTQNIVSSSPALGDIDGDGKLEVVVGSWGGIIYALNAEDGSFLWSYTAIYISESSPAIGDIDGDGSLEVVIGSADDNVCALNGEDGSFIWSYTTGRTGFSSPALGDIDGDGKLEVVIGSSPWQGNSNVYALNGENGSLLWSYTPGDRVKSSPALGDIDGDGKLEVVIGSDDYNVYAFNGEDGFVLWSYTTGGRIDYSSPALGDIDGDGKLEVVVGSHDGKIYALNDRDEGKPHRDIDISGTRSGSYLDTWVSDNIYESIEEQESKGNPNRRYSYLEHKWTIFVGAGNHITFYIEAYHTGNLEEDDFTFAYSTDDINYTDMLTVTKTVDDDMCQSFQLLPSMGDTVYIRVKDTDQTPGNNVLDDIFIDYMFIESSTIPDFTPPVISDVTSSEITNSSATITWDTDEYSNSVVRYDTDGAPYEFVASSADMVMNHSVPLSGLSPSTTYYYIVESTDASNNTATSVEYSFTTTAGGDELHVSNIEMSLRYNGPFTRGIAEVTIVGADGSPIAAATVNGHWSGLTNDTDQFITESNGVGSCDSDKLRNPTGWFIFAVDNVFKDGWVYNSAANVETTDSISVGGGGPETAGQGSLPNTFALYENHPNPFSSETAIRYALPISTEAKLVIYDVSGRVVKVLVDSEIDAGYYKAIWDGRDEGGKEVTSSIYFYRIQAGNYTSTKKLILMR